MPWHRDPFEWVAVVLAGDLLCIEYRDGGESLRVFLGYIAGHGSKDDQSISC
jgi:hypothetical protein